MSEPTLFDKIISGDIPSYKVWEDDTYLAFLTPFPNTPGFTVLIPKSNPGDYVFNLEDETVNGLMMAAKKVAKLLEKALDAKRVALVFEGTGVAHVHAKLIPLHGELGGKTNIWSHHQEFHPQYIGYLTTTEGPRMSDEELKTIQQKIQEAAK
jgi:diadenosine tetraphosphate (Ap4A) HIT family hydrolase